MQTATILHMNQEESNEKTEQDRRYRGSQEDGRLMRSQFDRLIGEVGDLKVSLEKMSGAIIGDNIGNEGVVPQMKAFKLRLDLFEERLDNAEMSAKQAVAEARVQAANLKADADKEKWKLGAICALLGALLMLFAKWVSNHFFK